MRRGVTVLSSSKEKRERHARAIYGQLGLHRSNTVAKMKIYQLRNDQRDLLYNFSQCDGSERLDDLEDCHMRLVGRHQPELSCEGTSDRLAKLVAEKGTRGEPEALQNQSTLAC